MIDYVKISVVDIDLNSLLNLPYLEFKTEVSEKTGEVSNKRVADYHYCKITVYDNGRCLMTGSIHKLWNSLNNNIAPNYKNLKSYKGYNGNQFTLYDILEIRSFLQKIFNCKPNQMVFQNIELGVNTLPKFNPNEYLKGLLYHRNKMFEYRYNNNLAQAIHQRFIFKIYNKSEQYGMKEYTLRVELKVIKTEDIKGLGIKTFEDINTSTLDKAKEWLLKRFDEVMHYDYTISKEDLTKNRKRLLDSYSNPRYWIEDLKPQHRDRHKKKLVEVTRRYSENLHSKVRAEINQKCVIINQVPEEGKCVSINTSSIGLNITQLAI